MRHSITLIITQGTLHVLRMNLRSLTDSILTCGAHHPGSCDISQLFQCRSNHLRIDWLHHVINSTMPTLLSSLACLIVG